MSSRFHNKWHRSNHHTTAVDNHPDSSHDPIASPEYPFQGDFIINGGLSANSITAVEALFDSLTSGYGRFTHLDADTLDILHQEIQGFVTTGDLGVSGCLGTDCIESFDIGATAIDIWNNLDMNSYSITNIGDLEVSGCLLTDCISSATVGQSAINIWNNLDMQGHSISGIGNDSLVFESGAKIQSDTDKIIIPNILAVSGNGFYNEVYEQYGYNNLIISPVSDFGWAEDTTTAIISSYNGPGGTVVIPYEINGKTVVSVSARAFYDNDDIVDIYGSSFLTAISAKAFRDCDSLQSVSLPGVTVIGHHAFYECVELENILMPAAINVGTGAFQYCDNLQSISLPVATSIGDYAFVDCDNLQSISLPVATSIGVRGFSTCNNLQSITLLVATSIGDYAFAECINLQSVLWSENEPTTVGINIYFGDSNVTNYVLEGATGWSSTFGGMPVVVVPNFENLHEDDTFVNGNLTVTDIISAGGIIFADGGNSEEWNSAYTTVHTYSAGDWDNTILNGQMSNVASASGDWNSTYAQVCSLSASWDGDFCNEVILLNEVSACNETISISGNLDMNGYSISGIGNDSLTFETGATISSDQNSVINFTSGIKTDGQTILNDQLYYSSSSNITQLSALSGNYDEGQFIGHTKLTQNNTQLVNVGATWTDDNDSTLKGWYGIAMSSDGKYQSACDNNNGTIWTSNDYGQTWTDDNDSTSKNWYEIAMSSDGKYQSACAYNDYIWTSNDYGQTWSDDNDSPAKWWRCITMSSDGKYQSAGVSSGTIWTSNDYGQTWADDNDLTIKGWYGIAMSSDGKYQSACDNNNGTIWTSNDYGQTWTDDNGSTARYWRKIVMSSDGKYQTACVDNGTIWTSNDYGQTWSDDNDSTSKNWYEIAMSSDGKYQSACAYNDYIWTSNDYGQTWSDDNDSPAKWWRCITMSSDGKYQSAGVSSGTIWTCKAGELINGTLNVNGIVSLSGDLNMNGYSITNIGLNSIAFTDGATIGSDGNGVIQVDALRTSDNIEQTSFTTISALSGLVTIDTTPMTGYNAIFYKVLMHDGASNMRISNVDIGWYDDSIMFSETSTINMGSTSAIVLTANIIDSNIALQASIVDGSAWNFNSTKQILIS